MTIRMRIDVQHILLARLISSHRPQDRREFFTFTGYRQHLHLLGIKTWHNYESAYSVPPYLWQHICCAHCGSIQRMQGRQPALLIPCCPTCVDKALQNRYRSEAMAEYCNRYIRLLYSADCEMIDLALARIWHKRKLEE